MKAASTSEIWLNNPANPDLSDDELKTLIGQYIIEAMLLIENDMQRRVSILESTDSTITQVTEALNTGLWYPLQYYSRIKPYKDHPTFTPRFTFMQKSGGFIHGSLSKKLWNQPSDTTASGSYPLFQWKKETEVSPAEELVKMLEGKSFCLVDCGAVISLVHYAALLRVWGRARFDKCFSGRTPFSLALIISNYVSINPMYLFLERANTNSLTEIMAGDKTGFKSHPSYKYKNPFGEASNWNVFCVRDNDVIKFVGFGLGVHALDETQVIKKLVDGYHQEPIFDEDLYIGERRELTREYFHQYVSEFSQGAHPKVINPETLKEQGGGCTGEYIRLNAEKVGKVLREPIETCSLFNVYRATTPQATNYAMDEATKNMWGKHMLFLLNQKKAIHTKTEALHSRSAKK